MLRNVKSFAMDLKNEIKKDNLSNGAAALAYYLMLAIFPAMIALLTFIPYLPVPNLEQEVMAFMRDLLPSETANLFAGTVQEVVGQRRGGLLTVGLAFTIFSASSGMSAIMQQLNATYGVEEGRSFIKTRATALFLTLVFGILMVAAFSLVVFGGLVEDWLMAHMGWGDLVAVAFATVRWLIILTAMLLAFAIAYYFGPDVQQRFKFITPGSVVGVILLVAGASGFRFYVTNFANYAAVYGGIGGVIVLLLWLYLVGFVILLGSAINAVVERRSDEGKDKGEKVPGEKRQAA